MFTVSEDYVFSKVQTHNHDGVGENVLIRQKLSISVKKKGEESRAETSAELINSAMIPTCLTSTVQDVIYLRNKFIHAKLICLPKSIQNVH